MPCSCLRLAKSAAWQLDSERASKHLLPLLLGCCRTGAGFVSTTATSQCCLSHDKVSSHVCHRWEPDSEGVLDLMPPWPLHAHALS